MTEYNLMENYKNSDGSLKLMVAIGLLIFFAGLAHFLLTQQVNSLSIYLMIMGIAIAGLTAYELATKDSEKNPIVVVGFGNSRMVAIASLVGATIFAFFFYFGTTAQSVYTPVQSIYLGDLAYPMVIAAAIIESLFWFCIVFPTVNRFAQQRLNGNKDQLVRFIVSLIMAVIVAYTFGWGHIFGLSLQKGNDINVIFPITMGLTAFGLFYILTTFGIACISAAIMVHTCNNVFASGVRGTEAIATILIVAIPLIIGIWYFMDDKKK